MTLYAHTVTFIDNEVIAIENMINDKIKEHKESYGESPLVSFCWLSILDKLKNAKTELASWTNYDEDGKPTININTDLIDKK